VAEDHAGNDGQRQAQGKILPLKAMSEESSSVSRYLNLFAISEGLLKKA
jgi:hypothetical protein